MTENLILTDVDGVLLNWEYAFDCWMQKHGYSKVDNGNLKYNIGKRYGIDEVTGKALIKTFNESAAIGFLPPLRDSVHYVQKLHKMHGFIFHAITSLSLDKNAQHLRRMNLEKLFGETVFEEIICLDTGADKHDALEPYRDSSCFWLEDKIDNAVVGHNLGLRSLIVEHGHNMDYKGPIPIVKNWAEIYNVVTGY
jgi:hypothetical protein